MKKQSFWTIFLVFAMGLFFTVNLNASAGPQKTKKTALAGTPSFPAEEYNEWLKVQVDPSIKDADKVACTIDAFFNIKYKSWVKLELLDFGFLFDRKNAQGAEDYAYERGLYHLMLTGWRECNKPPNSLESYKYEPIYDQLSIIKNNAKVRIRPNASIVHSDGSGISSTPWQEHSFTLVHKNDLWLIRSVVSSDEMRDIHPHGSDFNKLAKNLREWTEKEQIKEEAEFATLMKGPTIQQHLLYRQMLRK